MPTYRINKNPRTIKTIILIGQSNEEGGGSGTPDAQYTGGQNGVYIFKKPTDNFSNTNNGTIGNYLYGFNNNTRAFTMNYISPDPSLGYTYKQLSGEDICIIKWAYGGSILVDDGITTHTNGLWGKNANIVRSNGLQHYDILVNNFIIPAVQLAASRGITLDIIAGHMMQGEGDSQILYCANNWESECITFWDNIKTDLALYGINPNFKPIISRCHNNFPLGQRPYINTVRTAQENVANHYNSYWIDTDAYGLFADDIHYNVAGQKQHGIDIATILHDHF